MTINSETGRKAHYKEYNKTAKAIDGDTNYKPLCIPVEAVFYRLSHRFIRSTV